MNTIRSWTPKINIEKNALTQFWSCFVSVSGQAKFLKLEAYFWPNLRAGEICWNEDLWSGLMAFTCAKWSILRQGRVNGLSTIQFTKCSHIGTSGSWEMVARFAFTQLMLQGKYLKRWRLSSEILWKKTEIFSNACSKEWTIGYKSVTSVKAPNTAMTLSCSEERKTVNGSKTILWDLGKTYRKIRTRTTWSKLGKAWGTNKIKTMTSSMISLKVWCWRKAMSPATSNLRCRPV